MVFKALRIVDRVVRLSKALEVIVLLVLVYSEAVIFVAILVAAFALG